MSMVSVSVFSSPVKVKKRATPRKPPSISKIVIDLGSCSFTNFPLITEKKAAHNAEINAKIIAI